VDEAQEFSANMIRAVVGARRPRHRKAVAPAARPLGVCCTAGAQIALVSQDDGKRTLAGGTVEPGETGADLGALRSRFSVSGRRVATQPARIKDRSGR
jgi:hypothetical protein